jgi:hypothetical protein
MTVEETLERMIDDLYGKNCLAIWLQDTFRARHIVTARSLNCLTYCQSQSFES